MKVKFTYRWELKDIIMIGLVSVFFAAVYLGAVYFGQFLTTLLTPFGLGVLGYEFVYGIWFMAATFTPYIIQKPGVATVAEVLSAFLEVLMGNFYGPIIFVSGLIQGLGAEVVFAKYDYKRYDWKTMCLAAIGCTIFSFIWTLFRSGHYKLDIGLLAVMFVIRLTSSILFSAVGSKIMADRLSNAGVLKGYSICRG